MMCVFLALRRTVMAYLVPTFNITVNVWRAATPTTDPPDLSPLANFAQGRRVFGGNYESPTSPRAVYATSYLLLPIGTVLVGDTDTTDDSGDTIEVAAGDGIYYHCLHQERVALGFANEHVVAIVAKRAAAAPPGGGFIELEDSSGFVLMEGSGYIMLE